MAHRFHDQSRVTGFGHCGGAKSMPSAIDFQLIWNSELPANPAEFHLLFAKLHVSRFGPLRWENPPLQLRTARL